MKTQLKLVDFMWGKAHGITKLTGIETKKYFTSSDSIDIQKWSDKKANKIWKTIKQII